MTGRDEVTGIVGVTGETVYFDPGLIGLCVFGPLRRRLAGWIERGDGFCFLEFSSSDEVGTEGCCLLESAVSFKVEFEVETTSLGVTELGLDVCATPPKCPFSRALTPKRYLGSFSLPSCFFSTRGFLAASSSSLTCFRSLTLLDSPYPVKLSTNLLLRTHSLINPAPNAIAIRIPRTILRSHVRCHHQDWIIVTYPNLFAKLIDPKDPILFCFEKNVCLHKSPNPEYVTELRRSTVESQRTLGKRLDIRERNVLNYQPNFWDVIRTYCWSKARMWRVSHRQGSCLPKIDDVSFLMFWNQPPAWNFETPGREKIHLVLNWWCRLTVTGFFFFLTTVVFVMPEVKSHVRNGTWSWKNRKR